MDVHNGCVFSFAHLHTFSPQLECYVTHNDRFFWLLDCHYKEGMRHAVCSELRKCFRYAFNSGSCLNSASETVPDLRGFHCVDLGSVAVSDVF